jgi:glutathione S-transferase
MLKIMGRKTSVNVQKVMWVVGELNLPHFRLDMGGTFGGLETPEFMALNPNRLVPVIDDAGFVLWESNAIVRYLSEAYGRGSLAPEGRSGFARADQWMEWTTSMIYSPIIGGAYYQLIRTSAAQRDRAQMDAAVTKAGERLAILDKKLADSAFICGDALTIADIAAGALMYRYFTLPIARPSLPHVESWYRRLCDRPANREHVMVDYQGLKVAGA